jgi:AmmeMemoRadiSam system protein A
MLTDEQRKSLVEIARTAVTGAVTRSPNEGSPDRSRSEAMPEASGVFVTLKRDGHLRGCIGTLECRDPLVDEVARVAVSAAREDPRFEPVRPAELQGLDVEVSVLGPLEEIDPRDERAIEIGRHGLVVEQGHRRGLLLPQVATEWGWGREEFLSHTCAKAGLAPDCWRRGAKVYRFAAEVFGGGANR